MKTFEWLPAALSDLRRLHDFVKSHNPDAAKRAATEIRTKVLQLAAYPEMGRPMGDGSGRRELVIPFGAGNYMVRYRLNGGTIFVLRVWHSREEQIH